MKFRQGLSEKNKLLKFHCIENSENIPKTIGTSCDAIIDVYRFSL